MALDPKALKAGDVVVFGGSVEKTVTDRGEWTAGGYVDFAYPEGTTYFCDTIWQIAELKRKKLPRLKLAWQPHDADTAYQVVKQIYTPLDLLAALYADLATLTEAGYRISDQ